jgi:hypothetical protein
VNVHQKKKELLAEINFLWHYPKASDSERLEVLKLLETAKQILLRTLDKDQENT